MDVINTIGRDPVEKFGGFSPELRLSLLDESRSLSLSRPDNMEDVLPEIEIFDGADPEALPRLPQLQDLIEHERVPPPQGPPPPNRHREEGAETP